MPAPIAIVGIGCRFPGGLSDPRRFWEGLRTGINAVTEIPPSRADLARWYDPRAATPGRMSTRWGGFLDRIEEFDAEFFEIAPRMAAQLDPQQRLLLETAWEALEDAGCDASALRGTRTGVYVGEWINDFEMRLFADPEAVDFFATLGTGRYAASGRISYALGLRGPSVTIDTACSSSLIAVHNACQAIRAGECDVALAGGANTILEPQISIAYSQSRMMAQDGRCKFGDAAGDGYVRSEGAAMIVLKPVAKAEADGDRIYAVIRGSAANNDGRSSGSMGTPSREGQRELLEAAYAHAEIPPSEVQYVEAHGTGTRAGDPVEIGALGDVLAAGRTASQRAYIGSVKTNVGHTEGAAGVAGLIKAALALHHGEIPASLHLSTPNPLIPWADLPFEIPRASTSWPGERGTRMAGVSAFGIAGTNAHVVLGEAPLTTRERVVHGTRAFALPLSAAAPAALTALAAQYARLIEGTEADDGAHDVCATAALHRTPLAHRAMFAANSRDELADRLRRFAAGDATAAQAAGHADARTFRVAFAFPGQGSEWPGMARELMAREPVFRDAIVQCDAALRGHVEWSLIEQLERGAPSTSMAIIQPTLLAVEIALAALWRSLGVEPAALVGHSMGEVGAAYVAGAISLTDAMAVIATRSALMETLAGTGGMALTELSAAEAQARLAPFAGRIGIAVTSGPRSTVVSGDADAIETLVAQLNSDGVFCRRLESVSVASHSTHMDPLVPRLLERVASMRASPTRIPLYSTVEAHAVDGGTLGASYWGRNLREPVRFAETVQAMTADGIDAIIELSPHPVLLKSMRDVTAVGSLRREEPEQANVLASLGTLWTLGHPVDWKRVYSRGYNRVDLPLYPWQRERHWTERPEMRGADGGAGDHPLLGPSMRAARAKGTYWQRALSVERTPFLADHQVRGAIMFPAAGYAETVLAGARAERPGHAWSLQDVQFHVALPISGERRPRLQLTIDWAAATDGTFTIHAQHAAEDEWVLHASGRLRDDALSSGTRDDARDGEAMSSDEVYAAFREAGLEYGPAFALLADARVSASFATATVRASRDAAGAGTDHYVAYPPLLDAALQAIALIIARNDAGARATPIPISLSRLQVPAPLPFDETLRVTAVLTSIDAAHARGDVTVRNEQGDVVIDARGVTFSLVRAAERDLDAQLFVPVWRALPTAGGEDESLPARVLLLAATDEAAEAMSPALRETGVQIEHCVTGGHYDDAYAAAVHRFVTHADERRVAIVDAHSLDASRLGGESVVALARALAGADVRVPPRVWIVTRLAVATGESDGDINVRQAPLWGIGRVWMHEEPKFATTLVDVDGGSAALVRAMRVPEREHQIAVRGDAVLVPRLTVHPAVSTPVAAPNAERYHATIDEPGVPDGLRWEVRDRRSVGAYDVEIETAATGLNFMNLMSVLGVYPGYDRGVGPLGIECAGTVSRVGPAVTRFAPGDRVLAATPDALASHVVAHEALTARVPDGMAFDTAAGVPIAFLTAWYALRHLAHISGGERVLIHSAAGGVGLAAMQIATLAGAEIFATAGTQEKRDLLKSMGARAVFDSRDGTFADALLEATNGEGVDIVLNSLAGPAIEAGLRVLRSHGRFIELGKRDIYGETTVGLQPFRRNLSFFAVDLDAMMRSRPVELGRIMADVMAEVSAGRLAPLPTRVFAADAIVDAFQSLTAGTHVGKHVISHAASPSFVGAPAGRRFAVKQNGSYVITGGQGALGMLVARWLAERGAGCIVLAGRTARADQDAVRDIEASGTIVRTHRCDITDARAVEEIFAEIRQSCPPVRGVFHAAGVLRDAPVSSLDDTSLREVGDVKALGAENLDRATASDPLDAFVMFSSVASLFGTPGQGGYAAGNAFLDAFAHHRRARGLLATVVNFGPVRDIGLAAASRVRGSSLSRLGFDGLDPARVIESIDALLSANSVQAVCADLDPARWQRAMADTGDVMFLADLASTSSETAVGEHSGTLADQLRGAPAGQPRRAVMDAAVREEVGGVLRIPAERVASDRPLKALGMDSLMALELRNRLERRTGLSLTPSLALNYPTVAAIGAHLADRLGIALDAGANDAGTSASTEAEQLDELLAELENLSEEEVRDLLAREQ